MDRTTEVLQNPRQGSQGFFPFKYAYRRQCFYLRYHLCIGGKFGVHEFMACLHPINDCIPYFPRKSDPQSKLNCRRLPGDELCDILKLAKKPEWTIKQLEANQDPYDYDLRASPNTSNDSRRRLQLAQNILRPCKMRCLKPKSHAKERTEMARLDQPNVAIVGAIHH